MISRSVTEGDCTKIDADANRLIKSKQVFERCELTKVQALQLFSHTPFKQQIISNKVADGAMTSVYRCGSLIDLCMDPICPTHPSSRASPW